MASMGSDEERSKSSLCREQNLPSQHLLPRQGVFASAKVGENWLDAGVMTGDTQPVEPPSDGLANCRKLKNPGNWMRLRDDVCGQRGS